MVTALHDLLSKLETAAAKDLAEAKEAAVKIGEHLHLIAEDGSETAAPAA